jgi:UDP-glucose 4-epimerase
VKVLVVGGAGFIGSHVVDHLLSENLADSVIVYDNLSAGQRGHLRQHKDDRRLQICAKDIYDADIFAAAEGAALAIHLASNPDIAKALTAPDIDFHQGTALTQIVLEALRKGGCRHLLYASGSGVYGDIGSARVSENFAPMLPISTYGASKLACEALICSYCAMFGLKASAFRFGNVVGGRQTHGVAYDFLRKLRADPSRLEVMGNGGQSKPYIDVEDAVAAMFTAFRGQATAFEAYNVAPDDFINVREIVDIVLRELQIPNGKCAVSYGELGRGWKGDVPIVRLNSDKMRALGWSNRYTSAEAMLRSVRAMLGNSDSLLS